MAEPHHEAMNAGAIPSLSPQLQAIMSRQRGLFTAEQAYSTGYSRTEIQHLRSRRMLRSVRRGVYGLPDALDGLDPLSRHAVETVAALLRLREPTTLSHETAAIWTGVPLLVPDLRLVHMTRPELRVSRREAAIHHHPGALPPGHVKALDAVAVTTTARTAVDVARRTDFSRGLAVADSCLRLGTSRDELQAVMEFCASWPGARAASRAVSHADARAANPGESWSRAVLLEAGLAPTHLQYEVHDDAGLIGFSDVCWEDRLTLGEFDGRLKYALPAGAEAEVAAEVVWREKQREDRLRAQGFEVVRWTWGDLHRPGPMLARILAAFARSASRRRTAN